MANEPEPVKSEDGMPCDQAADRRRNERLGLAAGIHRAMLNGGWSRTDVQPYTAESPGFKEGAAVLARTAVVHADALIAALDKPGGER